MSKREAEKRQEFMKRLAATLPPAARREFGELEQITLGHHLAKCGMTEYPAVTGDPNGERCSGEIVCDTCGQEYYSHPPDWRVIGYGDVPFLNVLCDGRRVKL